MVLVLQVNCQVQAHHASAGGYSAAPSFEFSEMELLRPVAGLFQNLGI